MIVFQLFWIRAFVLGICSFVASVIISMWALENDIKDSVLMSLAIFISGFCGPASVVVLSSFSLRRNEGHRFFCFIALMLSLYPGFIVFVGTFFSFIAPVISKWRGP